MGNPSHLQNVHVAKSCFKRCFLYLLFKVFNLGGNAGRYTFLPWCQSKCVLAAVSLVGIANKQHLSFIALSKQIVFPKNQGNPDINRLHLMPQKEGPSTIFSHFCFGNIHGSPMPAYTILLVASLSDPLKGRIIRRARGQRNGWIKPEICAKQIWAKFCSKRIFPNSFFKHLNWRFVRDSQKKNITSCGFFEDIFFSDPNLQGFQLDRNRICL